MKYLYRCECGPFETETPADTAACLKCGGTAKRVWSVAIHTSTARPTERYWDPQVGAVVGSAREFNDLLKAGAEKQSEELNMECKLTPVDARDDSGLAELHGTSVDHRLEEREKTQRVLHDEKAKANKEHRPTKKGTVLTA